VRPSIGPSQEEAEAEAAGDAEGAGAEVAGDELGTADVSGAIELDAEAEALGASLGVGRVVRNPPWPASRP
jgi:hypothetical protein